MSEFKKKFKFFDIFRLHYLRNILVVAVIVAILLTLGDVVFIYPAFSRLLSKFAEDEATRMATHLKSFFTENPTKLSHDVFTSHLFHEIQKHARHFKLMEIELYSKSGKTLYSTRSEDIGKINTTRRFLDSVAKGKTFTRIVKKGLPSLEGQKFHAHAVEIFIPIMNHGAFAGAFEIYYDITDAKESLDKLLLVSSAMTIILAVSLLVGVIQALIKAGTNINQREQAEAELKTHRDHLEDLVTERTAELSEANTKLTLEIAERRQVEQALQESEEKLAGILNSVTDAILLVDRDLNTIWANPIATDFFGRDLVGKKCCDIFNFRVKPHSPCSVIKCFEDGINSEQEIKIIGANGAHMDLWCTASVASRSEDGTVKSVIMVYRDLSEKKLLRAETARASQLASIGELAAGVAHEINNPINGIINCAQMLIDDGSVSGGQTDISHRILKAGERIATIVKNLLSFAGHRQEEPEPIRLHILLCDSLNFTETQIRNDGIDLQVDVAPDIPMIFARGNQIQQVFLNVISNARYALNEKFPQIHADKVLKIKGAVVDENDQQYARLIFWDQGGGMSADILDRICDPFFSTKPAGEGTGLGLSVSHAIIKDHGGKLSFDSVEGEYAKVIIDLPLAMAEKGIRQ